MADQFSDELVERAWIRSGGRCECESVSHSHTGRCNNLLVKGFRGKKNSYYGWEAHSKSGSYSDSLSDCEILCYNPCYKSKL